MTDSRENLSNLFEESMGRKPTDEEMNTIIFSEIENNLRVDSFLEDAKEASVPVSVTEDGVVFVNTNLLVDMMAAFINLKELTGDELLFVVSLRNLVTAALRDAGLELPPLA